MPRLLSVNVGLPRDTAWRGKTVRTAIWKTPVQGGRMVRRLNIDGDGQGDLVNPFKLLNRGLPSGKFSMGSQTLAVIGATFGGGLWQRYGSRSQLGCRGRSA